MSINDIRAQALHHGMVLRGGFTPTVEDDVPCQASGELYGTLLMFGQLGSSVWTSFLMSEELADGKPDPMDRWSYRIGSALADEFSGLALFPFRGPPWHPFGKWAQKAEAIRPSPLGILLHPHYGLWHAYRFAIALPEVNTISIDQEMTDLHRTTSAAQTHADASVAHACDQCASRPCLNTCPVNAFTEGSYDVAVCCEYLSATPDAPCHQLGCLARRACPVGTDSAYVKEHTQFHMRQFLYSMAR